jgi:hypothetical protein
MPYTKIDGTSPHDATEGPCFAARAVEGATPSATYTMTMRPSARVIALVTRIACDATASLMIFTPAISVAGDAHLRGNRSRTEGTRGFRPCRTGQRPDTCGPN